MLGPRHIVNSFTTSTAYVRASPTYIGTNGQTLNEFCCAGKEGRAFIRGGKERDGIGPRIRVGTYIYTCIAGLYSWSLIGNVSRVNGINGSLRARRLPEDTVDAGHDTIRLPLPPASLRSIDSIPVSFILADKDAYQRARSEIVGTYHVSTCHPLCSSTFAPRKNDQRYVRYLDSAVESKQLWLARKLPFLDLRARALFLNLSLCDGRGWTLKNFVIPCFHLNELFHVVSSEISINSAGVAKFIHNDCTCQIFTFPDTWLLYEFLALRSLVHLLITFRDIRLILTLYKGFRFNLIFPSLS